MVHHISVLDKLNSKIDVNAIDDAFQYQEEREREKSGREEALYNQSKVKRQRVNKKSKIYPQDEPITLVQQELSFDLSGIQDSDALEGLRVRNNGYMEIEVQVSMKYTESTNITSICVGQTREEAGVVGHRRSIGRGRKIEKQVFLTISCEMDNHKSIIRDFDFGLIIKTTQLSASLQSSNPDRYIGGFCYHTCAEEFAPEKDAEEYTVKSVLKIGADINAPHVAQLSLTIQRNIYSEWSYDFLKNGGEVLWDYIDSLYLHKEIAWNQERPIRNAAREFYDAVTVTSKEDIPDAIQHPELDCELFPFQARTVRWMLRKEGFDVQPGSTAIIPYEPPSNHPQTMLYEAVDKLGRKFYVSRTLGMISTNRDAILTQIPHVQGGILAEEMGLGKTVELIALIALHRRPVEIEPLLHDEYSGKNVRKSAATLIITPRSILEQWISEMQKHAPHLKVHHYHGVKEAMKKKKGDIGNAKALEDLQEDLLAYDVVITTYNVLSAEIHFAREAPERNLRRWDYEARPMKSPLVGISWWRVCLDEAQMIESGVSAAAEVARVIPRINAWCVTGTPIRRDVGDLLGLLIFLRYEPISNTLGWRRLVTLKDCFQELMGGLTVRHSKADVRDEVDLPPQKRIVVTVPFSPVEEVNYNTNFEKMIQECEITVDGCKALSDPDRRETVLENMRRWLLRLRQMCSHAQVGRMQDVNALRTVDEVLDQMIEEHQIALRADERVYINNLLKRGQFLEADKHNEEAQQAYQYAYEQLKPIVQQCRVALAEEQKLIEELQATTTNGNGKGKQREGDQIDGDDDVADESDYDEELERDNLIYELSGRIGVLRLRLRGFLVVEHACLFFLGSIYYQLKSLEEEKGSKGDPDKITEYETKEAQFYADAKAVRKELLTETEGKAQRLIDSVKKKAETQVFADIPESIPLELKGGIEVQTFAEDLRVLQETLNVQANHLDEWREEMIQILASPLVDQDEDAKGNEFEESLAQQENGFAYMEAINAAISDREEALTGRHNLLAQEELTRALSRKEEYTNLLIKLIAEKSSFNPVAQMSMKGILNRLRAVASSLKAANSNSTTSNRADLERQLAEAAYKTLHKEYNEQVKAITRLKRESDIYRNTINARLQFYRQLQALSDSVIPIDIKNNKNLTLEKIVTEESLILERINQRKSKANYLSHLKTSKAADKTCIICQSEFEEGCMTVCGHQYCLECIVEWCKQHKTCPMCKHKLNKKELHPVTYAPKQVAIQEEEHVSTLTSNGNAIHAIYSDIQDIMFERIKMTRLEYSFGSKIDMICKHVLYITKADPTAKAVVFSQWSDMLQAFGQAFRANGIKYSTLERDGVTRFKQNPEVKCFLLHAKSQSAGLTLVNATHVFICEPLLSAGLELQAISRVHRIGQTKPTTVWLYIVNNTVEQSILELSTRRRLALMGVEVRDTNGDGDGDDGDTQIFITENKLDEANSLQLLQYTPAAQKRGKKAVDTEVVVENDLVDCLVSSARGKLERESRANETRRTLMAGAAESRTSANGAGGAGAASGHGNGGGSGGVDLVLGAAGPAK